jgi:hypothetical protein
MSVGIKRQNIIIQFHFWEYINGTRHLHWILTGPSFGAAT